MTANSVTRLRLLFAGVLLVALVLWAKLFFVQLIKGDFYAARADRQYQRPSGLPPERGTIYFSAADGQLVSAAAMQNGFLLALNPQLLERPAEVYEKLNAILPLNRDEFEKKAGKTSDPYEELLSRVPADLAAKIEALELSGVMLLKTRWRVYPGRTLAAHAIGFLGYDGDELTGRYGLERFYNDLLIRPEDENFISFIARAFSEIGAGVRERPAANGGARTAADLILTIEPTVQQTLEKTLTELGERYLAEQVGGVIMDPISGELVALGAWPTFDPGGKVESVAVLQNPLVENVYEMGSIIKPLTLASALDAGVIVPATTYHDAGFLILNGERVANFDGRGRGTVSMQEVLNQSLNTGAVFASQKLGSERFRQYFLNFGLGEPTGIDLPNEASGLLKNLSSRQEVDVATAAFGQGIALTPLATVRALSALAVGRLPAPRLVKRFDYVDTRLSAEAPPAAAPRQVLKPETAKTITGMLVRTVDEALLNGAVKMEHYQIAAKTGTAQMPTPGGGYDPNRFLHSFFGYFPASQPRFIVFLYLVNPRGVRYASETLTQPFMELTRFLLNYYHLPPDR